MRVHLVALIFGSVIAGSANAADWYGFTTVGNAKTVYFFDRETVSKGAGSVTLWIKTVNEENTPDSDGSYATAFKYKYHCKDRKSQNLVEVTYGKNQEHMKTFSEPSKVADVVPGTVGEILLKVVCAPKFPNDSSGPYVKVSGNDIYAAAKRVLDPAPK